MPSADRSRPWQNPTLLTGFQPDWLGQFDTFDDWVNHATRALTGLEGGFGEKISAVCVDAKGRRCHIGGDFMRARDEDAFPVRYFVTGHVVPQEPAQADIARLSAEVEARDKVLRDLKAWIDTDLPAGTPGAGNAHMAISKALAAGQDKTGGEYGQ